MSSPLVDQAIWHAQCGFPVFPCKPRGKTPLTSRGFKDATTDENLIRAWWKHEPHANFGIHLEAAGLAVLDIDGPEGVAPFHALDLPRTRQVTTGRPEGGAHHYYRLPTGESIKTAKLADALDLRAAGAYVIGAGSIHPSGATYTANEFSITTLSPAELTRLVSRGRPPKAERPPMPTRPRDPSGDPLKGIDPPAYCWLLTGKTPNSRGKIPCPLHDDWDGDGGSCHFYPTADEGWFCYGCLKGGDIYSFAQALWGDEPFPNLRLRLVDAVMKGGGDV